MLAGLGIMIHLLATSCSRSGSERVKNMFNLHQMSEGKTKNSEYIHRSIRIDLAVPSILHFHSCIAIPNITKNNRLSLG